MTRSRLSLLISCVMFVTFVSAVSRAGAQACAPGYERGDREIVKAQFPLGVCDAASAIDGGIAEGKSRGGYGVNGGSGGGDGPAKNMA